MMLMRSTLILSAGVLVAAVTMAAQGPPAPQPPAAAMTVAKTWTDDDYERLMKQVQPAIAALRKAIDGKMAEQAEDLGNRLEDIFEEVEDFWDARGVKEAEIIADEASEHADHIADAADQGDLGRANEYLKLLQAQCANCHGKFREKTADGGFKIKAIQ